MIPPCRFEAELTWHDGRFVPELSVSVDAQGRVHRVQPRSEVTSDVPRVRLPGRALLPGLVNGHSHAFQRLLRGRTEYVARGQAADDFWSWRESMYRAAAVLHPEDVYVASRQAFVEMAQAGITQVGEFHYLHHGPDGTRYADPHTLAHAVIRAARDVGLRMCLLRVGYARAGFGLPENPRQRRFIDPSVDDVLEAVTSLQKTYAADSKVTVGVAPHSVRAVPKEWLLALASARLTVPVHMHVAEQPKEISNCLAEHQLRPLELVAELGLLGERFTAVHAIHLTDTEISLVGQARATVCACPSTERNLGDGVVRADALLRAGAHVSLGSDSQVTIDLLDEARQLEGHLRLWHQRRAVLDPQEGEPAGLAKRLLRLATAHGARSLGLPEESVGGPGSPADFFTVDLGHPALAGCEGEALLPALVLGGSLGGASGVQDVVVGGVHIVEAGRHPLAEQSARDFAALAKRVFA